ncbi:protein Flattop [Cheilinus undulatus]|uniref:protein Flattop n=1 Tax=Cheilinus undulatus TaxID=241271 RepID=UPI001BD60F00|nr:protein Flattop [Cheilinus undulatus]
MSSSFSANQYDGAFSSTRLQNWCETRTFRQRPGAQEGHSSFIADDRGHLLPGVRKRGSAWPHFKGTWDLPARIPARPINPTGRSEEGLSRLRSWGFDTARSETRSRSSEGPQGTGQSDGADPPPSAAQAPPASQDRPVSGGSQNQDGETTRSPGAAERDRTPSPAAEEKPAVSSAASQGSRARSVTGGQAAEELVPGTPSSSRQSHRDARQHQ